MALNQKISELSLAQKQQVIQEYYTKLTNTNWMPNQRMAEEDQIDSQLASLQNAFQQNRGVPDPQVAETMTSEMALSDLEDQEARRKPRDEFEQEIRTGEVQNHALFYAYMAENDADFEFDDEITPTEIITAQGILAGNSPEQIQANLNTHFQEVSARAEVEKAQAKAKLAADQAVAEQRAAEQVLFDAEKAEAELSALRSAEAATNKITHKLEIHAFATEKYDGKYELDSNKIDLTAEAMNYETQEYLHGMLRMNNNFLEEKYISPGKQFADKWEMRDAMYHADTPYDGGATNAKLSDFGRDVVAELTDKMELRPAVDGMRQTAMDKILGITPEQPAVEDKPLAPIPAEELPPNPTVEQLVASSRVLPEHLKTFDDPEMENFYSQLNVVAIMTDKQAPRSLKSITSRKNRIEEKEEDLARGEKKNGEGIGSDAAVKGDLVNLRAGLEKRVDSLPPEQQDEINQYLADNGYGAPLPGTILPPRTLPKNLEAGGDSTPVDKKSPGDSRSGFEAGANPANKETPTDTVKPKASEPDALTHS